MCCMWLCPVSFNDFHVFSVNGCHAETSTTHFLPSLSLPLLLLRACFREELHACFGRNSTLILSLLITSYAVCTMNITFVWSLWYCYLVKMVTTLPFYSTCCSNACFVYELLCCYQTCVAHTPPCFNVLAYIHVYFLAQAQLISSSITWLPANVSVVCCVHKHMEAVTAWPLRGLEKVKPYLTPVKANLT